MNKPLSHQIRDIYRDAKVQAKDSARDIKDQTVLSYEVKRKEIEDKRVPAFAKEKLTPEEIKRAGDFGLFVGFAIFLIVVFAGLWYFFGRYFV